VRRELVNDRPVTIILIEGRSLPAAGRVMRYAQRLRSAVLEGHTGIS
jgi:hypothetical protein